MTQRTLALPYAGTSYVPPVRNTTQGWNQSAWMRVVSGDSAVSTLDTSAGVPSWYTDPYLSYYHGGVTVNNHWWSKPTTAAGGSGDNIAIGAVTPRQAAVSQLGFCRGVVGTLRYFLSLDQLFKASQAVSGITTTQAVGSMLEPEAVANFVDFCHILRDNQMKMVLVLFVQDATSGHSQGFFYQGVQNIAGTQTSTQIAQTQSYLNAVTEFIQAIDKYPICRDVVAFIDLHNEAYYQLGGTGAAAQGLNSLVAGGYTLASVQADAGMWMRELMYTARQASPNFLYGFSQNGRTDDASTNVMAPTPANQQAAIRTLYPDVDGIDYHIYVPNPMNDAPLAACLAAAKNLPFPWFVGECAWNIGSTLSYDGNALIEYWALDFAYKNVIKNGGLAVCTPSIGFMSNQTSASGGVINYEPQTCTGLAKAVLSASP